MHPSLQNIEIHLLIQAQNVQDKLRTVDIWELENQKIEKRKNEDALKSSVDNRAWIPITEASA